MNSNASNGSSVPQLKIWIDPFKAVQADFFVSLVISTTPFLGLTLLILALFAILRRVFSTVKLYKRSQQNTKQLKNYLIFLNEEKTRIVQDISPSKELSNPINSSSIAIILNDETVLDICQIPQDYTNHSQ